MKVVSYMLMVMLEVLIACGWSLLADGTVMNVGFLVIGVFFVAVFNKISQYKEDAQ